MDEYFVQIPFLLMSAIFQSVEIQYQKDLEYAKELQNLSKTNRDDASA